MRILEITNTLETSTRPFPAVPQEARSEREQLQNRSCENTTVGVTRRSANPCTLQAAAPSTSARLPAGRTRRRSPSRTHLPALPQQHRAERSHRFLHEGEAPRATRLSPARPCPLGTPPGASRPPSHQARRAAGSSASPPSAEPGPARAPGGAEGRAPTPPRSPPSRPAAGTVPAARRGRCPPRQPLAPPGASSAALPQRAVPCGGAALQPAVGSAGSAATHSSRRPLSRVGKGGGSHKRRPPARGGQGRAASFPSSADTTTPPGPARAAPAPH